MFWCSCAIDCSTAWEALPVFDDKVQKTKINIEPTDGIEAITFLNPP